MFLLIFQVLHKTNIFPFFSLDNIILLDTFADAVDLKDKTDSLHHHYLSGLVWRHFLAYIGHNDVLTDERMKNTFFD